MTETTTGDESRGTEPEAVMGYQYAEAEWTGHRIDVTWGPVPSPDQFAWSASIKAAAAVWAAENDLTIIPPGWAPDTAFDGSTYMYCDLLTRDGELVKARITDLKIDPWQVCELCRDASMDSVAAWSIPNEPYGDMGVCTECLDMIEGEMNPGVRDQATSLD